MACGFSMYSESEYAAWTLVNGHAVNHVTISTHRLKSRLRNIKNLNQFIEDNNIRLNSEGGVLKGLLTIKAFSIYIVRQFDAGFSRKSENKD